MKSFLRSLILFFVFGFFSVTSAGTLEQAYAEAQPGMGYDKLLILNPDSAYTGGLNISGVTVGIKGCGALINLSGSTIGVTGSSRIEIDGCVIVNGTDGISIQDSVSAIISHCTFYGNQVGIRYMCQTGNIEVVNTIVASSSQYGFACHNNSSRKLHYMNMYENSAGDYRAWCPG